MAKISIFTGVNDFMGNFYMSAEDQANKYSKILSNYSMTKNGSVRYWITDGVWLDNDQLAYEAAGRFDFSIKKSLGGFAIAALRDIFKASNQAAILAVYDKKSAINGNRTANEYNVLKIQVLRKTQAPGYSGEELSDLLEALKEQLQERAVSCAGGLTAYHANDPGCYFEFDLAVCNGADVKWVQAELQALIDAFIEDYGLILDMKHTRVEIMDKTAKLFDFRNGGDAPLDDEMLRAAEVLIEEMYK